MEFITQNWQEIGAAITALILLLEAILNLIPTKKDYSILLVIKKVISIAFPNKAKGEDGKTTLFETISDVKDTISEIRALNQTKRQQKKEAKADRKNE